ncbi:MAG: glycosyltransferase family 39 protein [Candidatus Marsarchaeota archaeon]|nr:glycosyltransferase family 39 protein [Candidatus Marsarchaeota archaeon]
MNYAIEEYTFTVGILIAFIGTIIAVYGSRHSIYEVLRESGMNKRLLLLAIVMVLVFAGLELAIVKPTQQLFFDDVIYQGMAQDLIHTGQAWMCNYGTPAKCFIGQTFHEPIGTAFTLGIAFLAFGVNASSAYGTGFFLAAVSVLFTFLIALVLSKEPYVAVFSTLFMALSPILLVWAYPTTSDMPMLAYSLIAIFFMLVFSSRRNAWTFMLVLSSLALLAYMKIDAIAYVVLIPLLYIIISDNGIKDSIRKNAARLKNNAFNTPMLVALLIFVIAIAPEVGFAHYELQHGSYGYADTTVQKSCSASPSFITPSKPIDLQNLEANICGNINFWLGAYNKTDIIQPFAFTAFAIVGIAFLAVYGYWRQALFLGIWFLAFFLLYTSFYAGGVLYGVDWRFMLSVITPVCIFGGYGVYGIIKSADNFMYRWQKDGSAKR